MRQAEIIEGHIYFGQNVNRPHRKVICIRNGNVLYEVRNRDTWRTHFWCGLRRFAEWAVEDLTESVDWPEEE